jgi:hypothetical protein
VKTGVGETAGPGTPAAGHAGERAAPPRRTLHDGGGRCGPGWRGGGRDKCVDGDRRSDGQQADACGAESPACAGGEVRQDRIAGVHRYTSFSLGGGMPNHPNWGVADMERRRWGMVVLHAKLRRNRWGTRHGRGSIEGVGRTAGPSPSNSLRVRMTMPESLWRDGNVSGFTSKSPSHSLSDLSMSVSFNNGTILTG